MLWTLPFSSVNLSYLTHPHLILVNCSIEVFLFLFVSVCTNRRIVVLFTVLSTRLVTINLHDQKVTSHLSFHLTLCVLLLCLHLDKKFLCVFVCLWLYFLVCVCLVRFCALCTVSSDPIGTDRQTAVLYCTVCYTNYFIHIHTFLSRLFCWVRIFFWWIQWLILVFFSRHIRYILLYTENFPFLLDLILCLFFPVWFLLTGRCGLVGLVWYPLIIISHLSCPSLVRIYSVCCYIFLRVCFCLLTVCLPTLFLKLWSSSSNLLLSFFSSPSAFTTCCCFVFCCTLLLFSESLVPHSSTIFISFSLWIFVFWFLFFVFFLCNCFCLSALCVCVCVWMNHTGESSLLFSVCSFVQCFRLSVYVPVSVFVVFVTVSVYTFPKVSPDSCLVYSVPLPLVPSPTEPNQPHHTTSLVG